MAGDPHMLAAARRHLNGLGVTLWADWDISKPEGVEKAAEWLTSEIEAVLDVYETIIDERENPPI